jgi:hypothetical protein
MSFRRPLRHASRSHIVGQASPQFIKAVSPIIAIVMIGSLFGTYVIAAAILFGVIGAFRKAFA